jgi:hypothetical protein
MNEQFDQLHQDLADLAGEVTSVDLRNRALATSRKIGIRRAVAGTAAAALVLLASAGVAYAVLPEQHNTMPAGPPSSVSTTPPTPPISPEPATSSSTPSAPASPSTTVTAPATMGAVLTVDPRTTKIVNAAISIPAWPGMPTGYCPAKVAHFHNGRATAGTLASYPTTYNLHYEGAFIAGRVIYANLDGTSNDEALITVECDGENSTHPIELLAVRLMADGTVRTLGFVINEPHQILDYDGLSMKVSGSTITLEVMGEHQSDGGPVAAKQVRGYRYGSGGFKQVSGPTTFPALPTDIRTVDLRNATITIGWENCGNGCTGYAPVRMVNGVGTSLMIDTEKGVSRLISATFRIDQTTNGTDQLGNVTFIRVTETGTPAKADVYLVELAGRGLPGASLITAVGQDGIASITGISGGAGQVKVTVTTTAGTHKVDIYRQNSNSVWKLTN